MRVGAIPNPKKTIIVKGSQEEVSKWLYKVCPYLNSNIKSGYIQEKLDEHIGRLEIGKTEFLSVGARVIVDTNFKDNGSTEVNIEVQRKVGAFDQSYEITYANEHLSNIAQAIQYVAQNKSFNPPKEDSSISTNKVFDEKKKSSPFLLFLAIVGWLILLAWWFL